MSTDVERPAHVICGTPIPLDASDDPEFVTCTWLLWRTYGPAGSLWCPDHGHVLDVLPSPPLIVSVHLNYGGGKGEWVELGAL